MQREKERKRDEGRKRNSKLRINSCVGVQSIVYIYRYKRGIYVERFRQTMERKKDENRRKMEAASGRNDREKGTWKVREREREEGNVALPWVRAR